MSRLLRRFSLLGELSPWVWLSVILLLTTGCDVADFGGGPMIGSLVAALGSFAYALRTKVTADAKIQEAILAALTSRDLEIAQIRLLFEAAIGRERMALNRLEALSEEFEDWRKEHGMQRLPR